jgi:CHRD domain
MSRLTTRAIIIGAVVGLLGVASYAVADSGKGHLKAGTLTGYEENPDLSTAATGTFEARIIGERTIAYKLTYSGLEGTVQQAHIHFGKVAINGGIAAFLCSNLPSPPPGTPACPASGSVTGEIDAADVIGPEAQGIEPGAFAELIAAMRAGHTYANVHSSKWPTGEIRTQILGDHKSKHDKHG